MQQTNKNEKNCPNIGVITEIFILGCMLLDGEAAAKVFNILDLKDFYSDQHQTIFNAMLKIDNRKEKIDLVTLSGELEKRGHLKRVGGSYYLTELAEAVPSAAKIKQYIRKLIKDRPL